MTKREAAQFTCDGGCDTAEPEWQLSDGGLPELPDGWTAYRTRHYCRDCTAFIELTMDAIPGRRPRHHTRAVVNRRWARSDSVWALEVTLGADLGPDGPAPRMASVVTLSWDAEDSVYE